MNILRSFIAVIKTEHMTDLSALYFDGKEFFSDITLEEMHQIMNIDGKYDKYKLLRYFACQVGSFNRSESMGEYKGKIGGMALEYFERLIPINKSTVITFNRLLEENHLLFVIRHKDFYQGYNSSGNSTVKEIPNTYSRWKDRELAKKFVEELHGYKYYENMKNVRTNAANQKRSLGQKLYCLITYGTKYDDNTLEELRNYAEEKNDRLKREYNDELDKGYTPEEPNYIDISVFGAAS